MKNGGALLNGAKLVCADIDTILDAKKFADFLKYEKISILFLTSALFDQHALANPAMFKYLKYLLIGGDVLNIDTVNMVTSCPEGSAQYFLNVYGPTENTTFTTAFLIKEKFSKPIPIGKPISNTAVYVLDQYLNLMPIGIPGELCAGGDGLSLGYLNKENLTKKKFVDLTITNETLKLYRTGDLVRLIPSGDLDFICRMDNQIKVRGFRIELDAIESCLLNHDAISQCAVIVKQDNKRNKLIVAYIVAKNNYSISTTNLREFLKVNLLPYMIPNIFTVMNKLPLNISGKIDKKKLASIKASEQIVINEENYVYPQSELEKRLFDIWKELLNLNIVGINDDFFHLGGHSLLITKMIMQIRQLLDVDIELFEFLEKPTIDNLVKIITAKQNSSNTLANSKLDSFQVFNNDIVLDSNIAPLINKSSAVVDKPNVVLLTGATGFLGAHLLNDLYNLSNAKIYCLIRADNFHAAYQRITFILEKYQLLKIDINNNKIILLSGDLAKPLLGLEQKIFDTLSEEVDCIYHCGAYVHHLYNYNMLRMINVLSTKEIVKLATYKKNKSIHYVSSLSTIINNKKLLFENFLEQNNLSIKTLNGYTQTKLASELILTQASKRGIKVYIYRPSWITGHSVTGALNTENNHLFLFIKGCIQMGYAPLLNAKLNMLPVDFISNFIIKTSMCAEKIKLNVFNIISDYPIEWVNLFKYINKHKFNTKLISVNKWRQKYLPEIDTANAFYPLMPLYLADGGKIWANEQNIFAKVPINNTKLAMSVNKLTHIKINSFILDRYFNFFREIGFIP